VDLGAKAILESDRATMEKYLPPAGRALVAWKDDRAVGVVCLRKLSAECGEVKRMYVQPEQRGAGIGRALLDVLLDEARRIGYRQVRLDSPRFMRAAHGLYRRAGFEAREPYPESEIPAEYHRHWLFMEKMINERDAT
jgi:GNAT superfamily N-acetyltransferase